MRMAFCDDEKECRGELAHLLFEYTEKNTGYKINIAEFCTASALIKDVIRNGGYDIYILDIVMPEMNGIELGKWLRNHGHEGKIIYLTSSEEYAIESYKVKAFNYILKPINKNVMNDTINEIIKEIITKRERNIIIKSKGNSTRVNYDSIMYAELCRRIIVFHLVDGRSIESVTIRTTFSENVQELLRDNRFMLCGAGMIVNLSHITMVDNESISFKDTHKVFLSGKVCREVRSAWYDFWFDGEGSR